MNLMHLLWVLGGSLLGGIAGFLVLHALKLRSETVKIGVIMGFAFIGGFLIPAIFEPSGADQEVSQEGRNNSSLQDNPLLNALSQKSTKHQKQIEAALLSSAKTELTRARIDEYAITRGVDLALTYVPNAQDQSLLDLIEGLAVTTQRLLSEDAETCYAWLYGGYGHDVFDYNRFVMALANQPLSNQPLLNQSLLNQSGANQSTNNGLIDYQFSLYTALVEGAGPTPIAYDEDAAKAAVGRVSFQFIQAAGFQNTGLVTGETAPTSAQDYDIACQARYVLYQSLLREEDPASAIRELFSQRQ